MFEWGSLIKSFLEPSWEVKAGAFKENSTAAKRVGKEVQDGWKHKETDGLEGNEMRCKTTNQLYLGHKSEMQRAGERGG